RRYPAQDHQQTQLWLAYRRGRPVGRIGACIDHLFNELHDDNAAWAGNWGFVPASKAEVDHQAKALKRVIDPELMLAVERADGEALAVALCLPDVNEVLRSVRSGRLLPLGW